MKSLESRAVFVAGCIVLVSTSPSVFAGTPWWGTPPDPFNTEGIIRKDTRGLNDPTGRDCSIPAGGLTFTGAVNLALCRNPQTRSAWAAAHEQAAALGITESAWLPTVTATASESRQYGSHADINGNIVSTPQDTLDAAANLTWTLFDFGGRTGRTKSAHSLLDAASATAGSVVQQTVNVVVQSYYGEVAANALLASAKTTEEVTEHTLEITRALASGGTAALGDVLQAQTAYQQAVLVRVQADASAKTARGTLAVSLGVTADEGFKLDAAPVPAEVPALSARIAELMSEAARQRPDLKAAQAQRDAAEANVTVARSAGLPVFSIGAQHNYSNTLGVPNQNLNQIGVSVKIPIFTGFNVSYGIRQAQAALRVQEVNVEQVGLSVTLDVWSAYYSLDSEIHQLKVTADLLKTSEDNLNVALGRYKAGVGSILEVLTAQAAAATARQLRINAELGWETSRSQLALALGRLTSAEPLESTPSLP